MTEEANDLYCREITNAVGEPGSFYSWDCNGILVGQARMYSALQEVVPLSPCHYTHGYCTWSAILSLLVTRAKDSFLIQGQPSITGLIYSTMRTLQLLIVSAAQSRVRAPVNRSSYICFQPLDCLHFCRRPFWVHYQRKNAATNTQLC